MASSRASKPAARPSKPAAKKAARPTPKPAARRPAPAKGKKAVPPKAAAKKPAPKPKAPAEPASPPVPELRRADGRRHLLSLSFVRDGDEFMARMETDSGHITELKNRALDQLLTLVAGELEDLLE
ncbi:MAG: hypothetical protein ACLPZM_09550 [Thermoplasmata archaeon]